MDNTTLNHIIGWCNSDEDTVLCSDCFNRLYKDGDHKWLPLRQGEEDIPEVCDECQKKL